MNKIVISVVLVAVLASLGSCGKSTSHACEPPRLHWRDPSRIGELEPARNHVELNQKGKIFWNGSVVSDEQFINLLSQARQLNPVPGLQLEAGMGIECTKLEWARDQIEASFKCSNGGLCFEGLPNQIPKPIQ